MRLDGNFYKKEVSEKKNELNTRGNNIERYLLTRYEMNPQFATKVAGVLEKNSLRDNLLSNGMYDDVIEMIVHQITQTKVLRFLILGILEKANIMNICIHNKLPVNNLKTTCLNKIQLHLRKNKCVVGNKI